MPVEAFLLGLSNGAICLAYCAPVLVPCLMGGMGASGLKSDSIVVLRFLAGRMVGYIAFGVVAWGLGHSLARMASLQEPIVGCCFLILSIFLALYGLSGREHTCVHSRVTTLTLRIGASPHLLPSLAGLVSGLNFCPPFLIALLAASRPGTLQGSLFFFLAFFAGTSLFFIPVPFVGVLRRFPSARIVGKMAAGIMGLYYAYTGLTMLIGGLRTL